MQEAQQQFVSSYDVPTRGNDLLLIDAARLQSSGQQDMEVVRLLTLQLLSVLTSSHPGSARSGGRLSSEGSCDNLGYRCGQSAEKFFSRSLTRVNITHQPVWDFGIGGINESRGKKTQTWNEYL